MSVLGPLTRLLLAAVLLGAVSELSSAVGERIARWHHPRPSAELPETLQTRRDMMTQLGEARMLAISDPQRGERALTTLVTSARDPEIRSVAIENLVELAVREWPSGHQQAFLATVLPGALESALENQIPPSIILGQAALESGWGRSRLARDHHNLFGIKAHGSRPGVEYPTLEAGPSGVHIVRHRFRRYPDRAESIAEHGRLLADDARYAKARRHRAEWRRFLAEMAPTYASDPTYALNVARIIDRYNLARWDSVVSPYGSLDLATRPTREKRVRSPRG